MNRRDFLAGAAGAPAVLGQARVAKNVLLLIADDLGFNLGAYGDKVARTPNIDALAGEGVRFTNAYCTTASCSASRSVIHSGLQNHANGQYGHAHSFHHFAYLPPVRPVSSLLKDAGYRTGVIGKMHVNPVERFRWDLNSQGAGRDVMGMADRARKFMAEGGPWFLQMGYEDPHRAARGFANEKPFAGVTPEKFDPDRVPVPGFLPDNKETRGELAEYYQATNRLDQGIGRVMQDLRESGQLENTLVIFMSDNGMPFPNAKTTLYDAGAHLPLIMRMPGGKRGAVDEGFVSWTDIVPTILEWTGAKPPAYPLHGRSFLNGAAGDRVYLSHQFHELTMYYPMRGVRTARYKYLLNLFPELSFPFASDLYSSQMWQSVRRGAKVGQRSAQSYLHRPAEELYDVVADPLELNNLAGLDAHRKTLEELRADVARFRRETKDGWLINENYRG